MPLLSVHVLPQLGKLKKTSVSNLVGVTSVFLELCDLEMGLKHLSSQGYTLNVQEIAMLNASER